MALETGSFVNDLVSTNPASGDTQAQGDDHLRLLKAVLKATFPGFAGAIGRVQSKSTTYNVTGTDNQTVLKCTAAITLNLPDATAVGNGFSVIVIAESGAVAIEPFSSQLVNGALTKTLASGSIDRLICDGAAWKLELHGVTLNSPSLASPVITGTMTVPDLMTIQDNGDPTKQARFEVSSVPTGTTVVITLPSVSTTIPTAAELAAMFTAAFPPGLIGYTASSTPPAGWLERDGSAVSRTTYAALFAAIGITYGPGDGVNTFNLPDGRGEFDRGWDHGRGIDVGRVFGSHQMDAFEDHQHTYVKTGSSGSVSPSGSTFLADNAQTTATTGRTATETRPRNFAYLAIIKT